MKSETKRVVLTGFSAKAKGIDEKLRVEAGTTVTVKKIKMNTVFFEWNGNVFQLNRSVFYAATQGA